MFIFSRFCSKILLLRDRNENEVYNLVSCVIPTINFQRLKILLVNLFFIVEYIFLKQLVKFIDGKICNYLTVKWCSDNDKMKILALMLNLIVSLEYLFESLVMIL